MDLGPWIRRTRRAANLSQRQLAAQFGISLAHLCRMESSLRYPGLETIPSVARFLGVAPEVLLRVVAEEQFAKKSERLRGGPATLQPRQWSLDQIEDAAAQDRGTFLAVNGRDSLALTDTDAIPRMLCGLGVLYDEVVLSQPDKQVYAALFRGESRYRHRADTIAVATMKAGLGASPVSRKTLLFQVLHEVGHDRLHAWKTAQKTELAAGFDRPVYCSSGDRSRKEFQANAYAAAFLMPRGDMVRALGGRATVDLREHGRRLCESFLVESWTLRFRLLRLGIGVT